MNVQFPYTAISLLKRFLQNASNTAAPYYIFSPEEARIVYAYLTTFNHYGRPISVSFWDKSKQRIAFKKEQGELACTAFPKITFLKEHQKDLEALFSLPVNRELPFYVDLQELIKSGETQ